METKKITAQETIELIAFLEEEGFSSEDIIKEVKRCLRCNTLLV